MSGHNFNLDGATQADAPYTIRKTAHGFGAGIRGAYFDGAGDIQEAQADSAATLATVLVLSTKDANNLTVHSLGSMLTSEGHGLTVGSTYYLSAATAGALTTTAPSGSGESVQPILQVVDTDTLLILSGETTDPAASGLPALVETAVTATNVSPDADAHGSVVLTINGSSAGNITLDFPTNFANLAEGERFYVTVINSDGSGDRNLVFAAGYIDDQSNQYGSQIIESSDTYRGFTFIKFGTNLRVMADTDRKVDHQFQSVADAASIAFDGARHEQAVVVFSDASGGVGGRAIANPTNLRIGATYAYRMLTTATEGDRTVTWGTNFVDEFNAQLQDDLIPDGGQLIRYFYAATTSTLVALNSSATGMFDGLEHIATPISSATVLTNAAHNGKTLEIDNGPYDVTFTKASFGSGRVMIYTPGGATAIRLVNTDYASSDVFDEIQGSFPLTTRSGDVWLVEADEVADTIIATRVHRNQAANGLGTMFSFTVPTAGVGAMTALPNPWSRAPGLGFSDVDAAARATFDQNLPVTYQNGDVVSWVYEGVGSLLANQVIEIGYVDTAGNSALHRIDIGTTPLTPGVRAVGQTDAGNVTSTVSVVEHDRGHVSFFSVTITMTWTGASATQLNCRARVSPSYNAVGDDVEVVAGQDTFTLTDFRIQAPSELATPGLEYEALATGATTGVAGKIYSLDASGAAFPFTLPDAASNVGARIQLWREGSDTSGNTVTVNLATATDTLNGTLNGTFFQIAPGERLEASVSEAGAWEVATIGAGDQTVLSKARVGNNALFSASVNLYPAEEQMTWDTEAFDVGDNFAANQFVAPRTAYYLMDLGMETVSPDTLDSHNTLQIKVDGVEALRGGFATSGDNAGGGASNDINYGKVSGLVFMNAGQAATVHISMQNGIDITGNTNTTYWTISEQPSTEALLAGTAPIEDRLFLRGELRESAISAVLGVANLDAVTSNVGAGVGGALPFTTITHNDGSWVTDLTGWVDNNAASQAIDGVNTTMSFTVPAGSGTRDYRIRIQPPNPADADVAAGDAPAAALFINGGLSRVFDHTNGDGNLSGVTETIISLTAGDLVQFGLVIEGGDAEAFSYATPVGSGTQASYAAHAGGVDTVYGWFEIEEHRLQSVTHPDFIEATSLARGRIYATADQGYAQTTDVEVAFDTTDFATNITADLAGNKLTVTQAGLYDIVGQLATDTGSNDATYYAKIAINGTVVAQGGDSISVSGANVRSSPNVMVTKSLNIGDEVTLIVRAQGPTTARTTDVTPVAGDPAGAAVFLQVTQRAENTVIRPDDTEVVDQAASGYMDIGTMRIQWGVSTSSAGSAATVAFPVPFGAAGASIVGNVATTAAARIVAFDNVLAGSFDVAIYQPASFAIEAHSFSWQAIGLKP